jgi:hypothetical protein
VVRLENGAELCWPFDENQLSEFVEKDESNSTH